MKKLGIILIGLIIISGIVFWQAKENSKNESVLASRDGETTSTEQEQPSPTPQTGTTGKVTSPTPTPAPTPTPGVKQYTLADVSKHDSESDCWTTINGNVYNVTSWIDQHPGGRQAIISLCGRDGSAAFNDQHGGQSRPENELATFKIGVLK